MISVSEVSMIYNLLTFCVKKTTINCKVMNRKDFDSLLINDIWCIKVSQYVIQYWLSIVFLCEWLDQFCRQISSWKFEIVNKIPTDLEQVVTRSYISSFLPIEKYLSEKDSWKIFPEAVKALLTQTNFFKTWVEQLFQSKP